MADYSYKELAKMPLYEFMRQQGIGDFIKGSKEDDIDFFMWYMEEATKLHNLVSYLGQTDADELALYIKNLQEKAGENTDWYDKYLERKGEE